MTERVLLCKEVFIVRSFHLYASKLSFITRLSLIKDVLNAKTTLNFFLKDVLSAKTTLKNVLKLETNRSDGS